MAPKALLRFFFQWLYHPLAFAYDLVAAMVSLGRWNLWTQSTLAFIRGTRILELGYGPGHLQVLLRERSKEVYGLDESRQMGYLAKNRIIKAKGNAARTLVRGLSQALPFPDNSFDCLVSTFPSEYISDHRTLSEARRVLAPGGRLIVLPVAWPRNRLLAWLFRVSGEAPSEALDLVKDRLITPFRKAGLRTDVQMIYGDSGIIMILIAETDKS